MSDIFYGKKANGTYLFLGLTYLILLQFIQFPVTSMLKPLPIFVLMSMTFFSQIPTGTKQLLITALLLSALGDILLTLPLHHELEAGLLFFLFAHLFYIRLFTKDIKDQPMSRTQVMTSLLLMTFVLSALYMLVPHLGEMTLPVLIYVFVLTTMVFSAIRYQWMAALGASLFMLSDGLIGVQAFMLHTSDYTFWVMLMYYTSQFLMVTCLIQKESA